MTDTARLIVNTLAQNIRTLLNIALSLYATRIVMDALGQSDYGIYMLVAGIVSLLSYLVNALVTTTQRHLSYSYGQKDERASKLIFTNSYLLHWLMAGVLGIIALTLTNIIFDYEWLNIPLDKIVESKMVYVFVISSVFFTFITAPFRALLIAHENIIYISIIDVVDGILKLGLVFALYLTESYRLPIYAAIISFIMLLNLVLLAGYCKLHYKECVLIPHYKYYNREHLQKISSFATWTLYGTCCIFIRTQGLAVIFNRIYGTVINAAFGIATQVFGSVQFLSEAILNAIRPQIIKAEGMGDRQRMLYLSECACRFSFLLLSLVAIPLIIEMPSILEFWLGYVPELSVVFCRALFIGSLIDQLTIGMTIANAATGKIRNYSITVYTIKVLTVIAVSISLKYDASVEQCMMLYILFEATAAIVRIPFMVKTVGLSIASYFNKVLLRVFPPIAIMIIVGITTDYMIMGRFRFVISGLLCIAFGLLAIWLFGLGKSEKEFIICKIIKTIRK